MLIITSLSSCDQTVDLALPEYDSKLACYGILRTGESPRILINESRGYFDPIDNRDKLSIVNDATVTISTDAESWTLEFDTIAYYTEWYYDSVAMEWIEDSIPYGSYFSNDFLVENNTIYNLEVTQGGRVLSGNTLVPTSGNSVSLAYEMDTIVENFGGEFTCLTDLFNIDIQLTEENSFYELRWYKEAWTTDCSSGQDSCLIFRSFNGTYTFNSEDYSGNSIDYELRGWIDCTYGGGQEFLEPDPNYWSIHEFELYSISRETYAYKESIYSQWDNEFNPFTEPVPLSSNVEGGIGLFGSIGINGDPIRYKTLY